MADFFTRVPGPLEVMRRLGLNVPSSKQLGKFSAAVPEFVGPQADVAGMVRDAGQVMPNIQAGDYGQAFANLGMAAAAIPFMAIPGTVSQIKGVTKKVVDEPKKRVFHGSGSDYEGVPKATRTADDDFTGVSVTEDRGLASTYGKNIKEFEIKGKLATFDDLMDAENSIARKRGLLSAEDIGTGKSLADIDDPNYFQTMQKVKDELLERGFVGIDYEGSLSEMFGGGHGIRVLDPKALRKLK